MKNFDVVKKSCCYRIVKMLKSSIDTIERLLKVGCSYAYDKTNLAQ